MIKMVENQKTSIFSVFSGLTKKNKIIAVITVIAAISLISAAFAASSLNVSLGTITNTNAPANDIILSATLNGVAGTVAGNGQSVSFADSALTVGQSVTLSITVKNTGGTSSSITGSTPGGTGVPTINSIVNVSTYPIALAAGATAILSYTVTSVSAGTATPTVSISWS